MDTETETIDKDTSAKPDLLLPETQEIVKVQSKREAKRIYLMYLNETTARVNYKKKFTIEERPFKEKILRIEDLIEVKSDYLKATRELKELATKIPNSPRFLYASALLIDSISIFEQSNSKLKKCILIYKKIINIENINNNLLYISGNTLIFERIFLFTVLDRPRVITCFFCFFFEI